MANVLSNDNYFFLSCTGTIDETNLTPCIHEKKKDLVSQIGRCFRLV